MVNFSIEEITAKGFENFEEVKKPFFSGLVQFKTLNQMRDGGDFPRDCRPLIEKTLSESEEL